MHVRSVALAQFRSYRAADFTFPAGLTAIVGLNGQGKTNLLEAIGYMSGTGSLRGVPDQVLIRDEAEAAIVRGEVVQEDGREVEIEIEIVRGGRNRVLLNKQRVPRLRALADVMVTTVFSPDDLQLVKGGPERRRRWLDDTLTARRPAFGALRYDLDRILRQRNTLLRQARGRLSSDISVTLDVWDEKLDETGTRIRESRQELLAVIKPGLAEAYGIVAASPAETEAVYVSSWGCEPLARALSVARSDDVRRGVSTVGPHRDDVRLLVGGRPARTHTSQGEQRLLALALKLAADGAVRERRAVKPVLLLDDVFSELDPARSGALLQALPGGQCILTTTSALPPGCVTDQVVRLIGPQS